MTPDGESAIAGLLAGLPEAQGTGGLSCQSRMQPGHCRSIRLVGDREWGSRGAF
jgi:hypothetical protein